VFEDPARLRPEQSTAAITGEAAGKFAELAEAMRNRGTDGQQTAHFLVQCLFCMFAEDEGLLPGEVFTSILENCAHDPAKAARRITTLFAAMARPDGEYGDHDIPWFNGGLFATIAIPALTASDLQSLQRASQMDWRAIDPTIFGTLFERSLDPAARAPLGAHYTDTATIRKLITPLITEPLLAQWEQAGKIIAKGAGKGPKTKARKDGDAAWQEFTAKLQSFRVLDPACGSGNFLYLALEALRDVERRVFREARELAGYQADLWLQTGPHNILGIEINEYAAELARTTVWIGDLQWRRRNGRPTNNRPILSPLDGIEHRDALLDPDGGEAAWPPADVIVGNPPFLGGSMMRPALKDQYVEVLRRCYNGRVPGGADLVTYWFEKARAQIESGKAERAGLVATNSIRGGANRKVLERIAASTRIFNAWSDEEWVNEGAAVRVSLVCFGKGQGATLDGLPIDEINADLTGDTGIDVTKARPLEENRGASFQGSQKIGPFDISGELARSWLSLPNPNGRPNNDVLRVSWNGLDLTRRPRNWWIIDFGTRMTEQDAALYETPFDYVKSHVKPVRNGNNREAYRRYWWRHGEPRIAMRAAISKFSRYIATPEVSKHRIFVWLDNSILPDKKLIVIARQDDATFGILHSRFHEIWALNLCTWHGVGNDPRYTPTTTFETFPFPPGLSPRDTAQGQPDTPAAIGIAAVARRLDELRSTWLNPPEWVDWVCTPEEERAGFPPRPVAKPGFASELKKRTLTNLYNQRPAWLANIHRDLDAAVAIAYGWQDYSAATPDEEILAFLLHSNLTA